MQYAQSRTQVIQVFSPGSIVRMEHSGPNPCIGADQCLGQVRLLEWKSIGNVGPQNVETLQLY